MGAIRWTGKGLKLVGELLSAEEMEAWLQAKGRDYLESRIKGITLKWAGGRYRAKRQIIGEVSASIGSDTFRSALAATLSVLPDTVEFVARRVEERRLQPFYDGSYPNWLAVVPRAVVQHEYSAEVVNRLKQSAELARFAAFPEIFLKVKAQRSEHSFFNGIHKSLPHECPSGRCFVIGLDVKFDWHLGADSGHYYCAGTSSIAPPREDRRLKREFLKESERRLEEAKVRLGALSTSDRAKASAIFRSPETGNDA